MKTFEVRTEWIERKTFIVEANSEQEAKDLFDQNESDYEATEEEWVPYDISAEET